MDRILKRLGDRVTAARRAKGVTQYELAKKIGVSKKTMNWIETGHTEDPRSSIIRRLARELGVSTDWLLGEEEDISEEIEPAVLEPAGT